MRINYRISFSTLYHKRFNSGYSRIIEDNKIIEDGFWGYFNYSCFDDEKKQNAHNEARVLLGETINKIIEENKVDVSKYKNIMEELNIKEMCLNDIPYKYSDDIFFTLYIIIKK